MRNERCVTDALKAKLASTRGETLVEVMASLLVAGLSILMLAMAISVSAHLISGSKDVVSAYYASSDALAAGTATAEGVSGSGTATVTAKTGGFSSGSVPVTYVEEDLPGNATGVSYEEAAS